MAFNQGYQENGFLNGTDGENQDTYDFDYQESLEYCYPLGYSSPSSAKNAEAEWVLSPPAIPASPYIESPASSVGTHHDPSWNPFTQSFQSSIDISAYGPLGNPQPNAYQTGYSSANTQSGAQIFVNLATINETATFDEGVYEDTPRDTYETPPLSSPTTNYPSREPNWGSRRNSSSSTSKSAPPTKRRKISDTASRSSHSHSRSKSDATPRLRSTTQSSRATTISHSSSNSAKSLSVSENWKGHTNHNQVEKQYRNRLNGQFETLLSALPNDGDGDGAKSRVSKAEVLMLAKRRIVELEREKMMLESERVELKTSMENLKKRFVELGGVCMP